MHQDRRPNHRGQHPFCQQRIISLTDPNQKSIDTVKKRIRDCTNRIATAANRSRFFAERIVMA